MLAHRVDLGHRRDDPRREVGRVRTGEAEPPDAIHRPHAPKQVGEVVRAVVIAVDGLAQQRHLGRAILRELPYLRHHVIQLAAPLRAARVRNDAERALVIAAALHRHEAGRRCVAHRRDVLVVLPRPEFGVGDPVPGGRLRQQHRKVAVAIRPDHQVHPRRLLQQRRPEALRHAAHHAEDVALPLEPLQFAHPARDPLLGVVPHRAGVHQHHVGVVGRVHLLVTVAREHAEHELGVGHVHLAAVGLDVDALGHREKIPRRRTAGYGATVGC